MQSNAKDNGSGTGWLDVDVDAILTTPLFTVKDLIDDRRRLSVLLPVPAQLVFTPSTHHAFEFIPKPIVGFWNSAKPTAEKSNNKSVFVAVNGEPSITNSEFVPTFPGPIKLNVFEPSLSVKSQSMILFVANVPKKPSVVIEPVTPPAPMTLSTL
jgi:hypothetical protein